MLSEKLRSTTGRVCPEHVNGVCRAITDGAEIKIYHLESQIFKVWENSADKINFDVKI